MGVDGLARGPVARAPCAPALTERGDHAALGRIESSSWGRSVADLVATLHELSAVGVAFVSLTEALDMSTPSGRALATMLAVFAEFERDMLRERVRGGLERVRREGKRLGRPPTAASHAAEIRALRAQKLTQAEIARRLGIGESSVRRILAAKIRRSRRPRAV